ncbi:uncharacterized protein LOC124387065 [Silurus meridionalis]|uniref:uncharacterized protein LOC124387065 n=1 Tax=Silurus meridionalis TaxID=175797 RepID=UPI001EEC34C8|nr:uncharacterized protein LOC124387065 [Silurus meridionalis]
MFTIIFMCLWFSIGDSMADSIKPLLTHKVVDEGDDVTLSCSYKDFSGSVGNLQWYKQDPKSNPKFILYIYESGALSPNNPPRTNAKVHGNKQVDLIISSAAVSDSALYYCVIFMCLWLSLGDSMGDSINPRFTHKVVNEGDDVTLSCSYSTSATYSYLHWYRQHPKSNPKFLLYIYDLSGDKSDSIPPRLDVKVDKTNKQVNLIISSAAVSDSALYYCALAPTVTGNPAALYKNLEI